MPLRISQCAIFCLVVLGCEVAFAARTRPRALMQLQLSASDVNKSFVDVEINRTLRVDQAVEPPPMKREKAVIDPYHQATISTDQLKMIQHAREAQQADNDLLRIERTAAAQKKLISEAERNLVELHGKIVIVVLSGRPRGELVAFWNHLIESLRSRKIYTAQLFNGGPPSETEYSLIAKVEKNMYSAYKFPRPEQGNKVVLLMSQEAQLRELCSWEQFKKEFVFLVWDEDDAKNEATKARYQGILHMQSEAEAMHRTDISTILISAVDSDARSTLQTLLSS